MTMIEVDVSYAWQRACLYLLSWCFRQSTRARLCVSVYVVQCRVSSPFRIIDPQRPFCYYTWRWTLTFSVTLRIGYRASASLSLRWSEPARHFVLLLCTHTPLHDCFVYSRTLYYCLLWSATDISHTPLHSPHIHAFVRRSVTFRCRRQGRLRFHTPPVWPKVP